jgi:hypothetical protein
MRTVRLAALVAVSMLTLAHPWPSRAGDGKVASAAPSPAKIFLSFKLDPRILGPTYGGEHWVSPPVYTGARAQDSVETRARAVSARGVPVKADPQWTVSDPEVVAVSPSRGERVTLTARRAGVSTVTVKAGGASRSFTVEAANPGGTWQLSLTQ